MKTNNELTNVEMKIEAGDELDAELLAFLHDTGPDPTPEEVAENERLIQRQSPWEHN
tara:strand:+ start:317 stop:487 length:171 start_codon:yes stop_codon:yes gene_type:complete